MRSKQPPPLLRKIAAICEPLGATGRSGGCVRPREGFSGVAGGFGGSGMKIIRPHGDAARQKRRNRKRSGYATKACSPHFVHLQTSGYTVKPTIISDYCLLPIGHSRILITLQKPDTSTPPPPVTSSTDPTIPLVLP